MWQQPYLADDLSGSRRVIAPRVAKRFHALALVTLALGLPIRAQLWVPLVERYTKVQGSTIRMEVGQLRSDCGFTPNPIYTKTWDETAQNLEALQQVFGKYLLTDIEYEGYRAAGLIPSNWQRSEETYRLWFLDYVIVGIRNVCAPVPNPTPKANLFPYWPDEWSGTLVVSTQPGDHVDAALIREDHEILLDWAMANEIGTSNVARQFSVVLLIDGVVARSWPYFILEAGFVTSLSDQNLGSLPAGDHLLELLVDAEGQIDESDENDNRYTKRITVLPSLQGVLGSAVDATSLPWKTGGQAEWFAQTTTTSDGVDAAQSGSVGYRGKTWIETSVAGPGRLMFQWKIYGLASLQVALDGRNQAEITGDSGWVPGSVLVPEGIHTIRWTYEQFVGKLPDGDAGWLDQVTWKYGSAPVIVVQPQPQTAAEGQSAVFEIYAVGVPPPTYQWRRNGSPIPGATGNAWIVEHVNLLDNGSRYDVVVESPNGTVTSHAVSLLVVPNILFAQPPRFAYFPPAFAKPSASQESLALVTHGRTDDGPQQHGWITNLAAAVEEKTGGSGKWAVRTWAWPSEHGLPQTGAGALRVAAINQGGYLGREILRAADALAAKKWRHVHLIGHSAGAIVIDRAAKTIKSLAPDTLVHCTFLDPFVGSSWSETDNLGGGSIDWADNYIANDTFFEGSWWTRGRLQNAFNVDVSRLDPKVAWAETYDLLIIHSTPQPVTSHGWPHDFYLATIQGNLPGTQGTGFPMSMEAGGWNPQGADRRRGLPPLVLNPEADLQWMGQPIPVKWEASLDLSALPQAFDGQGSVDVGQGGFRLEARRPAGPLGGLAGRTSGLQSADSASIQFIVDSTNRVNLISFGLQFASSPAAEGQLSVLWGTNLVAFLDERACPATLTTHTFELGEPAEPGTHVLGFLLTGFGGEPTAVAVTNVACGFAGAPEPISLAWATGTAPGNQRLLRLRGSPGFDYEILTSTNLQEWQLLGSVELGVGKTNIEFADPSAANQTRQFYRARLSSGKFVERKQNLSPSFDRDDGDFAVVNSSPSPPGPWAYDPAKGAWVADGASTGCGGPYHSMLNSPEYSLSSDGLVLLEFVHRYSFEGDLYDGGIVRVSLNGVMPVPLPVDAFLAHGYAAGLIRGSGALKGLRAFNGDSPGYSSGQTVTSRAVLGTFKQGDRFVVQFLGAWDDCYAGKRPNWLIDSLRIQVLPVSYQDFRQGNGGFTVENSTPAPPGPWVYSASLGHWAANGAVADCTGPYHSALTSPAFIVPESGEVTLRFSHRYSFESDYYDGGLVRISVNGGAFAPVGADRFAVNGYATTPIQGNGVLKGQRAFNGESTGYTSGVFLKSSAVVGTFNRNDTFRVQFLGAWDECSTGRSPNWAIKDVELIFGPLP